MWMWLIWLCKSGVFHCDPYRMVINIINGSGMGYIIHPIPVYPTKFQRASWWSWPCHGGVALSLGSYGPRGQGEVDSERHQFPLEMQQKSKNAEKATIYGWFQYGYHFTSPKTRHPPSKTLGSWKTKWEGTPKKKAMGGAVCPSDSFQDFGRSLEPGPIGEAASPNLKALDESQ